MPEPKFTAKPLPPIDITINDFTGGYNSLLDEARTPNNAARDVTNMMQKQDGLWAQRWGTLNYGASYTSLDGVGTATKDNGYGTFTQYLLRVNNGVLEKTLDTGSATVVTVDTTATGFTTGYHVDMVQIANRVYMANGHDKLMYYDIVLDKVFGYSSLGTPTAPTVTRTSGTGGLTAGSYTISYKITAVNTVGETIASPANSAFTVNIPRNNWQNTTAVTQGVDLSWTAVTNAVRYNIYYSDTPGLETYLDSVSVNAYHDDSSAHGNQLVQAPVADTTTGPTLRRLAISDNRIWGIASDGAVWWGGVGQYTGAFSPFYGGGYIYLEKGGNEHPTNIKFYRDGSGKAQTTIFTTSQDGTGSEWQITLSNTTIGNVSYITPAAVKVVGSTGSGSPDGIIAARNNIYYPSKLGFFTLGAKPQLLNVLSTDEISLPIRPDVRSLTNAQKMKIAGTYWDGKLFWAVPNGTTDNSEIWVLDLEHQSWARPWTISIKQFVTYTSSDGTVHYLGVPVSGTYLLEFSENYLSDNGVAIPCTYRSGLIFADKNHRQAFKGKYFYIEVARPQGTIQFTVLGTKKNKAFANLGSRAIVSTATLGTTDYSSELFSDMLFSEPASAPTTYSQASVLKRLKINKTLYNVEFEVTSNAVGNSFSINQFMISGHILRTSDPSSFKN